MINEYKIIRENNLPKLKLIKEFNYDSRNDSIDEIIFKVNDCTELYNNIIENSYVAAIDSDYNIIGIMCIGVGSFDNCFMNKRTIGMFLLLTGAEYFIALHNHPNGNYNPSEEDKGVCITLESFGKIFDINQLENVCISNNGYYKMIADEGKRWY